MPILNRANGSGSELQEKVKHFAVSSAELIIKILGSCLKYTLNDISSETDGEILRGQF